MHRGITKWTNGTKRGSVVLVLSAAVLVIVIDARATGWAGMARAGFTTKPTEITEGFWEVDGARGGISRRRGDTEVSAMGSGLVGNFVCGVGLG